MSMIDKEEDPLAFLGNEDDWAEDLDEETDELPNHAGALQPGDNVLFEGKEMMGMTNMRGMPGDHLMYISLQCPSQVEIQRHLWEIGGGGSADVQGRGVHQLNAVGPEKEEEWMSMIHEEGEPLAFLSNEDDWGEDLDEETDELPDHAGALQPWDNVLFEGKEMMGTTNMRGMPGVGHFLYPCFVQKYPTDG